MVKLDRIEYTVTIPEGVTATLSEDGVVTITGPKGTLTRTFESDVVQLFQDGAGLIVRVDLPRRKQRALAGTWNAHLNNMVKGVTDGFTYNLKAFYSHFPMTIKVQGNEMTITNLFGEKVPRVAALPWSPAEVEVKVANKTEITVIGADREKVGQTAANIERACRIKKRDRRVFQDGIYIVSKGNE